ncbi:MAG TPA: hypothetical protein DCY13_12310 [Verrucomicrobiales bacterium]|nr:hypothetical protein [Verrucomicrobiales bacterium]
MIANWFLLRFFLTGAMLFSISLGVSFFAKDYVRSLAEDFACEHAAKQSERAAANLESQLANPIVAKFLPDRQREKIEAELIEFRRNRIRYVREAVTAGAASAQKLDADVRIADRIAGFKRSIATAFDDTMAALVRDLAIFNSTNVAAFLIAWCLARLDRPRWAVSLTVLSFFLFLATLYATWMYIDQNWFFNILFKSHMGWSYPALIAFYFLYITFENAGDTVRLESERQEGDVGQTPPGGREV